MSDKAKSELELEMEMAGIFSDDITTATAAESENSGGDPNIYVTSLKHENVVNGVYKSVVRFVRNPRNTKEKVNNIFSKWMYFLPHPDNASGRLVVDCTSNWGQRDNIITSAFFYLRNTKNPSLIQMANDNFSRKKYYFTLLQVVKDIQQPDLEGTIKIYRFANQVNEKIEDITKDDEATGQVGVNYSNPFHGRDFIVNVAEEEFTDKNTQQVKTQVSYSKSKFTDKATILKVPNVPTEEVAETKEYMMKIFSYLKEAAPVLEDYEAKRWDEDTENLIIESVRMTIGDDNIFNQIYKKVYKKSYVFGSALPNAGSDGNGSDGNGLTISADSMLEKEEIEEAPAVTTPNGAEANGGVQTSYGVKDDLPEDLDEQP